MNNIITEKQSLAISYIRAFAVLLIVNSHLLQAINNKWAWVLNVGVQIFFCMSGFLHGRNINNEIMSFIFTKAKRVYIPYIIFFTLALVPYILFQKDLITTQKLIGHILALQAFTKALNGLQHLWFITIILICYTLTPIVEKLNYIFGFSFWCLVFVVSIFWFSYIPYYYHYCLWILTYFVGYFVRIHMNYLKHLTIALVICFLAILPFYRIQSDNYIDYWMHAVGGACFFVSICYLATFVSRLPLLKSVRVIDKYSYEIYLTHGIFIFGPFSLLKISNIFIINIVVIWLAIISSSFILRYITKWTLENKIFNPTNRSTGLDETRR